jgi:MFS family permease
MTTPLTPSPVGDSQRQRWTMVFLFLLCLTCSYIDRQVISLLVEPIKHDLGLTDFQIGLVQGFAFASCYALMGIPIARALDRGDRIVIAAGCVSVWSAATAACAFVGGYGSLLAARAMTAVAEAGLPPAALSLIGDRFERDRIARASAVFMLGPYLGTGLALLGGGALFGAFAQAGGLHLPGGHVLAPWRGVFLVVATPGLVLAPLLLLLRDPRRHGHLAGAQAPGGALLPALQTLRPFLVPYLAGMTLAVLVLFAQIAWLPTFFIRVRHLSPTQVGPMIGILYLAAGIAGSIAAGALSGRGASDALAKTVRNMRWAAAILAVSAPLVTLVPDTGAGLALFAISAAASSFIVALVPTPLQLTAPASVRAQVITIGAFVVAVGGAGGGPFLVGLLTDKLFGDPQSIGAALAVTCLVSALLGTAGLEVALRRAPR